MTATPNNVTGIAVNGPTREAINEVADAVIRIATCSPVPDVTLKALDVFQNMAKVEHITVSNCEVKMNEPAASPSSEEEPVIQADDFRPLD